MLVLYIRAAERVSWQSNRRLPDIQLSFSLTCIQLGLHLIRDDKEHAIFHCWLSAFENNYKVASEGKPAFTVAFVVCLICWRVEGSVSLLLLMSSRCCESLGSHATREAFLLVVESRGKRGERTTKGWLECGLRRVSECGHPVFAAAAASRRTSSHSWASRLPSVFVCVCNINSRISSTKTPLNLSENP